MGRAMLIICAAALVGLGIVGLGTANQGNLLTEKSAEYANEMTAKNAAHTAIQMAMQEINKDPNYPEWINKHNSEENAWVQDIGNATAKLYLDTLNNVDGNDFWETDSIRMVSKAEIDPDGTGPEKPFEATINSVFLKEAFSTLVPKFTGSLTNLSDNVNVNDIQGSASIHGIAPSEANCPENKPGITVTSEEDSIAFANATTDAELDGTETINVDSSLSYEPTDELIERLSNSPDTQILPSGTYEGSLGTPDNPGVFFVNDGTTKLKGQTEGYGILVVRNNGELGYDGELDLKGTFDFHGLVIFENADALDAKGTANIYGSMIIGDTEADDGNPMDIDVGGNVSTHYDCRGEGHAKKAAAMAVDQFKYTRVVTFEETGFSSN